MTELFEWRSLNTGDFDHWMVMLDAIQAFDHEHERTNRSDLETFAEEWKLDSNSIGAFASDGTLAAYGRNGCRPGATDAITVFLLGGVHPDARGRGLGRKVLEWQLERAAQNVAGVRDLDPGAINLPAKAACFVEEQIESRGRLMPAAGFTATRWFLELQRTLAAAIGLPPLPAGLVCLPFTDDLADRTRMAHNEAFADHHNPHPFGRDDWQLRVTSAKSFRPAMSFVLIDETTHERPVVAYVLNNEYVEDWPDQGFRDGYTEYLGVVRERRAQGLARYLLDITANAFLLAGHQAATISVDGDNPTGAADLYLSQGYVSTHRTNLYTLER